MNPAPRGGAAGGPSDPQLNGTEPAHDEASALRLDMLGGGTDAFAAPEPKKRRFSNYTLFLGGLVVVGAGLLLGMRQLGMGPLKSAAETPKIDYDLTKSSDGQTKDHTKILAELSTAGATVQVPVDQVQKNPFKMPDAFTAQTAVETEGPGVTTAAPDDAEAQALQAALERQQALESELATFRINGILSGSQPAARINDDMKRVGDRLGENFTIAAIRAREVELEADGKAFILTLDLTEGGPASPAPRKKK